MTEQRPENRADASASDIESLQPTYRALGDGAMGHDHPHFALLYETTHELFSTAIPFLQEGLEQGERCWYIVDDTTEAEVVEAMSARGIDVETAREAGDLVINSPEATYFEDGEFDPAAMINTWTDRARQAIDQEGYEGLRIAGEATWELAPDGDELIDGTRAYESRLNELFAREDCHGLCMYNRERFPPETLEAVITHHPHVIYDETVAQNVYYTPPAEVFDGDNSQAPIDRQIETLIERTRTKNALEQRKQQTEQLNDQLIDTSPTGVLVFDSEGEITLANDRVVDILGVSREELTGLSYDAPAFEFIDPNGEPMPAEELPFERVRAADNTVFDIELGVTQPDGQRVWLSVNGAPLNDGTETAVGPSDILLTLEDITERKQREQLLEEHNELLEQIATGASLEECLSALCNAVSRLIPDARASILLAEEEREAFQYSVAPDLPPSWGEALEGAPINDELIGTCGEAVYRDEAITCEDVTTDDRWSEDWRDLCVASGVMAGHSTPIRDADGTPWGSFMLCFDERGAPTDWEHRVADFGTHIASIALERNRSRQALRKSEERLRFATDSGEMGVWELNLQTNDSPVRTPRHDEIFGYEEPLDDWNVESFLEHVHPDDRKQMEQSFEEALHTGEWTFECRIIRADDERRWITAQGEFHDDDTGEPVRGVGTVQDITERKQREQRLERQREQIEQFKDRLLETSPTGILAMDASGTITQANDRATDILGMTREELIGLAHNALELDVGDLDGEPLPDERLPFEQVKTADEALFGLDVGATRADGQRVWLSVNIAPLHGESDEPTEIVVSLEDITEHKQLNEALTHLNDASRDLMEADAGDITDRAAAITRTVLDVEYTALWHYDDQTGDLQSHTSRTAPQIDQATMRYPDDFDERAWQAFVSNEIDASTDLSPTADRAVSDKPLRSDAIIPLGRHGVIYAGSIHFETFDETTVDLAETVAATVETALDRAADEQQLERQNTALTQLNQINDIIREIDQGLVQADTREEIDQLVCECLAASARYEFAWIGEADPTTDTVAPREWAGVDPNYLDAVEITTDDTRTGQGPVGTALRTREPQVVEDIVTAARFVPWREQTLEHDVRSCISVPLCYEDTLYGVLTVYAAQPLNDPGYEVLAELGETIGHAINAVETKRTLQTDSVVELGLHLREPDTVLATLAQQAACTIEFEGFVPHADGSPTVFFTVHGASADEVHQLGTDSVAVEALTRLSEHEDGRLYKARIGGPTLASSFVEQEAVVRSLTIEEQAVSAIVELSQAADVRTFIDAIQARFPSTELRSRRTRDQSLAREQPGQTTVEEELTPRQQDVLHTAYRSGFFESPRDQTGQEIADMLGVSQPTFVEHLRASQRNLLTTLLDSA